MSSRLRRAGLPVLIILGGLVVAIGLVGLRSDAVPVEAERALTAVRVQTIHSESVQAVVTSSGITTPAREVTVLPEVTGRVVFVSDDLVPGGRFREGQVLARIDPRDYELAVEQQRALVRSAELELELEGARQETAREEWKILGDGSEPSPLVLRESQRAAAEMNLVSSRSGLTRAELDLERSVIRAPFNASVVSESVDVGQVAGQQTEIARLVGTDQLRVTLSVRVEELALIGYGGGAEGSVVRVRQRLGSGEQVERVGRVATLVDRVDPETRRAELLVLIDAPLDSGGLPLLPGSSVDGEILGNTVEGVFAIPRSAVYDGDTVWLVDEQSMLLSRTVEPVWGDDDFLYVKAGLEEGGRLVVSPLSTPIEGTRVAPEDVPLGSPVGATDGEVP